MISVKRLCRILLVEAVAWLTCIYTSTTTTTFGGRLYTHSFGPSGIDMCALDSPSTTLPLGFSLARCAVECNRLSGCKWFNYFTNQTNGVACQLYTSPPLTLDMTSGCALHSVSTTTARFAKNQTNTALGRPTSASSYWPYDSYAPLCSASQSSWAVDGNLDPDCRHCSCWASILTGQHWWSVDLGNALRVYGVDVTGRDDGGGSASACTSYYAVVLTNTSPPPSTANEYLTCGQWPFLATYGQRVFIQCPPLLPLRRYVVVKTLPQMTWNFVLCEAEVYATDVSWQTVPDNRGSSGNYQMSAVIAPTEV